MRTRIPFFCVFGGTPAWNAEIDRSLYAFRAGKEERTVKDYPSADKVRERLMRYARINTQSQPYQGTWPTTPGQFDLARELARELVSIGVENVHLDEKTCVLYAWLPASPGAENSTPLGLIAHMDTAPDASGEHVRPWVLEKYDGGDIVLNEKEHIVMKVSDYPNLRMYIGQDLVLTDGTTLLGGDDKASIAAIMTMAEFFCTHPDAPHGPLCLAFTPDEEVSGLAHELDLERFGAKAAYTLDGDHLGYYEDETFYASEAQIDIIGRSVHTGTAKGIMINAADIAGELLGMLPPREKPQYTEGTEGFFHVISCQAQCEHAAVRMIIRDFDRDAFARREDFLRSCVETLQARYGQERVSIRIQHQYSNMKEVLDLHPALTENLRRAISDCGLTPVCEPFRGGTDGAALSFRGLPCPNLSAGYENAHGRFEYVPVQSMVKNVEILLRLCALWA